MLQKRERSCGEARVTQRQIVWDPTVRMTFVWHFGISCLVVTFDNSVVMSTNVMAIHKAQTQVRTPQVWHQWISCTYTQEWTPQTKETGSFLWNVHGVEVGNTEIPSLFFTNVIRRHGCGQEIPISESEKAQGAGRCGRGMIPITRCKYLLTSVPLSLDEPTFYVNWHFFPPRCTSPQIQMNCCAQIKGPTFAPNQFNWAMISAWSEKYSWAPEKKMVSKPPGIPCLTWQHHCRWPHMIRTRCRSRFVWNFACKSFGLVRILREHSSWFHFSCNIASTSASCVNGALQTANRLLVKRAGAQNCQLRSIKACSKGQKNVRMWVAESRSNFEENINTTKLDHYSWPLFFPIAECQVMMSFSPAPHKCALSKVGHKNPRQRLVVSAWIPCLSGIERHSCVQQFSIHQSDC